jgi:hypothetical protein
MVRAHNAIKLAFDISDTDLAPESPLPEPVPLTPPDPEPQLRGAPADPPNLRARW